jgi:general secretion pathway protein G
MTLLSVWTRKLLKAARKHVRLRRDDGFTLVELMLVTTIIGTLAAIAAPNLQEVLDKARVAAAIGDIKALEIEIVQWEAVNNGIPPTSLAAVGRATLVDPWGNPYQYLPFPKDLKTGGHKPPGGARKDRFLVPINSSFDLYSMGKDGATAAPLTAKAAKDDVIRANDGGYVGIAEGY